jgi:hypothetical protein
MATSALSLLTTRVEALEAEVARLKRQGNGVAEQEKEPKQDWVNLIYGAFADYPDYDKVIELGRKYRESLRPKATRKKATRKKTIRNKAARTTKNRGR